jgi:glycyl-tRNA synthetase
MATDQMDKLVALCKRRGFIFPSSEIYGGINGFWDYGPLGVELKRNIKDAWWNDMVRNPPPGPDGREISMVGLDCAIIMNPKVWVASGHVGGFSDPMVDCLKCRARIRADKVWFGGYYPQADQPVVGERAPFVLSVEADNSADAAGLLDEAFKKLVKKKKVDPALQRVTIFSAAEVAANKWTLPCPNPKGNDCDGTLTEPRAFNLMFESHAGAIQSEENKVYLRPETAQGIFVNFKNVLDSTRLKLPFGIAQVGKAFRNEINPRNYTFRSREFEQMEIEFFCHPSESRQWYEYWRDLRLKWYSTLGIRSDRLRPREQGPEELAHYSKGTTDIEYLFPFSEEPQELEGVAHRGDFDLKAHMEASGRDLTYFEEELWQKADKSPYGGDKKKETEAKQGLPFRYVPHVIEPSAGADRFTLAVLCEAYTEDQVPNDKGVPEERVVMKFHPRLAPVKAAILPLVNKEGMPELAEKLYRELKAEFNVFFDDGGAIGRRYRRQDEIGTPFCVTVDGDTLKDGTVTLRDRDTLKQRRVRLEAVAGEIRTALKGGV